MLMYLLFYYKCPCDAAFNSHLRPLWNTRRLSAARRSVESQRGLGGVTYIYDGATT